MNNLMNNLYQKPKTNAMKQTTTKQTAGEAIDISSDDDSADDTCTNGKSSDGSK